jgi:hypothetical protein
MRIINIRPSKKFKGAWLAFEATGIPNAGTPRFLLDFRELFSMIEPI